MSPLSCDASKVADKAAHSARYESFMNHAKGFYLQGEFRNHKIHCESHSILESDFPSSLTQKARNAVVGDICRTVTVEVSELKAK